MNDLENLRRSFRPKRITTLFVGESPPHGGTFFYKQDSLLYRRMKESFGDDSNFLPVFQATGFFLDDLVLYPINQIERNEREQHRWKGVQSLAQRMTEYKPLAVVTLMRAIEPMVADAMRKADLGQIPLYVTPFPSRPEHQERFRSIMAEIIPKLPVAQTSEKLKGKGILGQRI